MTKRDLAKLKAIRKHLTMESYAHLDVDHRITDRAGAKIDATAYIVESTRRWRETWILPVLDDLIAAGERKVAKRGRR